MPVTICPQNGRYLCAVSTITVIIYKSTPLVKKFPEIS